MKKAFPPKKTQGSAALEYLVVTLFGVAIAFTAIGLARDVIEEKIETLSDELGIVIESPFSSAEKP